MPADTYSESLTNHHPFALISLWHSRVVCWSGSFVTDTKA